MNNKDLISQYVDTGLSIPEHQVVQLPNWAKKTYVRKRLIATQNSILQNYEFILLSEEQQSKYINNLSDNAIFTVINNAYPKHSFSKERIQKDRDQMARTVLKYKINNLSDHNISTILKFSKYNTKIAERIVNIKKGEVSLHSFINGISDTLQDDEAIKFINFIRDLIENYKTT